MSDFNPENVFQEFLNNSKLESAYDFLSQPEITEVFILAIDLISLYSVIGWAKSNKQPWRDAQASADQKRQELKDKLYNNLNPQQQATILQVLAELGAEVGFWGHDIDNRTRNYAIDLGFELCDPDTALFIRAWIQLTKKAQWEDKSISSNNIGALVKQLKNTSSEYYKRVFPKTAGVDNPKLRFLMRHQPQDKKRPSEDHLHQNVQILKEWLEYQGEPPEEESIDDVQEDVVESNPEITKLERELEQIKTQEDNDEVIQLRINLKDMALVASADDLLEVVAAIAEAEKTEVAVDDTERIEDLLQAIETKKKEIEGLKDQKREEENFTELKAITGKITKATTELKAYEDELHKLKNSKSQPPKSTPLPAKNISKSAGIRPEIQGGHVGKAPEAKPTPARTPEPAGVAPTNVRPIFNNRVKPEDRIEPEDLTIVNPPPKKESLLNKELDKPERSAPRKEQQPGWDSLEDALAELEQYPNNQTAKNLKKNLEGRKTSVQAAWSVWQRNQQR